MSISHLAQSSLRVFTSDIGTMGSNCSNVSGRENTTLLLPAKSPLLCRLIASDDKEVEDMVYGDVGQALCLVLHEAEERDRMNTTRRKASSLSCPAILRIISLAHAGKTYYISNLEDSPKCLCREPVL